MKQILITTIAAVVLAGCAKKAPDISIHEAASNGNLKAVKQHLDISHDVEQIDKKYGNTPLISAAFGGQIEIVNYLISKKANLDAQSHNGWTALHVAAWRGEYDIVQILINHDADARIKNSFTGELNNRTEISDTPLDTAIKFNNTKIADLLRKHGAKKGN